MVLKQHLFCTKSENKNENKKSFSFFVKKFENEIKSHFCFHFLKLTYSINIFRSILKYNSIFSCTQTNFSRNTIKHNLKKKKSKLFLKHSHFYFTLLNQKTSSSVIHFNLSKISKEACQLQTLLSLLFNIRPSQNVFVYTNVIFVLKKCENNIILFLYLHT